MLKLNEKIAKIETFGIGVYIENIDRFRNLNTINNNSIAFAAVIEDDKHEGD